MSTNTNKTNKTIENASHSALHLLRDACGHNRTVSETVLPYQSRDAILLD